MLLLSGEANAARTWFDGTAGGLNTQLGFWFPPPIPPINPGPRDLRVKTNHGTYVEIKYRCAGGADRYDYERQVDGGAWRKISGGICPDTWGRIPDPNVLPRDNYCYRVIAHNERYTSDPSETLCVRTSGIPRVSARSDLDRPISSTALGEWEMTTGRLSKIPVSGFWTSGQALFQGGHYAGDHDIQFRARCSIELTEDGRCDTGMFVHYEACEPGEGCRKALTLYNDDDPDPRAHGDGSGSGSFIDPPRQPNGVSRYTVHLFSRLRATSRTRLEYSLDGGTTWYSASPEMEVGGTLVNVGALHAGDWLEAESLNDGEGSSDTRLVLFHPSSGQPVLVGDDQNGSDADPRIEIADAGYLQGTNLLLLGKQQSVGSPGSQGLSRASVESWVDLVHGPHPNATSVSRTDCNGPCSAQLDRGRYLLWVYASIDQPVGSIDPNDPNQDHSSGQMPIVETCTSDKFHYYSCKFCPNQSSDGLSESTWFRGQSNDIVLSLDLQKRSCGKGTWSGVCYWNTLQTRDVTRAVLGTDPIIGGLNLLSMELDARSPGEYRISVREHASGLRFFDLWRYQRNPEATELKLVSFNSLFGSGPNGRNLERYRNMANLLGTRGRINPTQGRVEMRQDQAPFQWEADIIGVQEISKRYTDGNGPDLGYSDVTLAELTRMSSLAWQYSIGRGEQWFLGVGDGPGMNSIFVNQFHQGWPSLFFSDQAKSAAGCSTKGLGARYMECELDENGIGYGDFTNYATPAKARARRSTQDNDRPIATFNVHLESSDGPADFRARLGEVETLIEKIDALMLADPDAFNRSGSSKPIHHQNRIVIMGDWNIRCHYCGEHYWLLRKLREHYGYAVDTSMAVLDSNGRPSFGMHDQGYPIGADGVPVPFQHQEYPDLLRDPPAWQGWRREQNHLETSVYPWWAADYRGTTDDPDGVGERLSAVILVGRGWAYDDPVLDYRLMNDRGWTSPMHASPNAVEMWRPGDCSSPGSVPFGKIGYAPNYSLGCDEWTSGGTNPGAPALHTDHKPIGVRLRVWQR